MPPRARLRAELLEARTVPASLTLAVSPAEVPEGGGPAAATGTVTRVDWDLTQPLTVDLASTDPSEVTVPASVVIPAGAASVTFPVAAVDDDLPDGPQTATVTASAALPGAGPLAVETTWGNGGWVGGDIPFAVAVQPDGKLVTSGFVLGSDPNWSDFRVTRYLPDGRVDTAFGTNGRVVTDITGEHDQGRAVAVAPDGKVVVAGYGYNGPHFDWLVARYTADGRLDTTFSGDGKLILDAAGYYNEIWDVAVQPDGKIVLAGNQNEAATVARLNADGTPDTTFGVGGFRSFQFAVPAGYTPYARGFGVALQPDGKVVLAAEVVGGNSVSTFGAARLTAAGALDPTFGGGDGKVEINFPGSFDGASDVLLQPDGKIVLAGRVAPNSTSNRYDLGLARLNPDGTLDPTFGTRGTGLVVESAGGMWAPVRLAALPDGTLVAAATLGYGYEPDTYSRLYRLTRDGVLIDTTRSAYSAVVESLAVDADGGVYLGYTYAANFYAGYVDKYRGGGGVATATADVTVADDEFSPVPDAYTAEAGTALTVAAPGVRANDVIPDPDGLAAVPVAGPGNGTVTLNPDGSFVYTPNPGFAGADRFTYRLVAGGTESAAVAVDLTVNRPPVAVADAYAVAEDGVLEVGAGDPTPAGNSLVMTSEPGDWVGQGRNWSYGPSAEYQLYVPYGGNTGYTNAVSLAVRFGAGASQEYWYFDFQAANDARMTAGTTYTGAARFPFHTGGQPGLSVSGNGRGNNTLTGEFTVLQIEYDTAGQPARFAARFSLQGEGTTAKLRGTVGYDYRPAPGGVLANDSDPDGDPLTAAVVTGPANGTLALDPDGSFRYTPNPDFSGTDSFVYSVADGITAPRTATATITVAARPDVTAFQVNRGQAQRSIIRHLTVTLDSPAAASALTDLSRLRLVRRDLAGNNPANVPLASWMVSAAGSVLSFSFGSQGVGGARNSAASDGHYTLELDLDGDGTRETARSFYRLLGDTNGDRQVTQADVDRIAAGLPPAAFAPDLDVNGDGVVNATDRLLAQRSRGRSLAPGLPLDG